MVSILHNEDLPPGAGTGFAYDWTRQNQKQRIEGKKKAVKLKKKINKLTKKNKVIRRK